eukprot:s6410_g10.t1
MQPSPIAKRRRYSCKSSPRPVDRQQAAGAAEEDPEEDQFVLAVKAARSTHDPRAAVDTATGKVMKRFAKHVTLPASAQHCAHTEAAYQLPDAHCGFAACTWAGVSEAALAEHVRLVHADELQELAQCLQVLRAPANPSNGAADQRMFAREQQALYDAYRFAITVDCQSKAPLACTSLDRRCLRKAVDSLEQAPPETRICMLCAQRFAFVSGSNADIRFSQELQPTETSEVFFLGQSPAATAAMLGRDVFVARYVEETAGTPQGQHVAGFAGLGLHVDIP